MRAVALAALAGRGVQAGAAESVLCGIGRLLVVAHQLIRVRGMKIDAAGSQIVVLVLRGGHSPGHDALRGPKRLSECGARA